MFVREGERKRQAHIKRPNFEGMQLWTCPGLPEGRNIYLLG